MSSRLWGRPLPDSEWTVVESPVLVREVSASVVVHLMVTGPRCTVRMQALFYGMCAQRIDEAEVHWAGPTSPDCSEVMIRRSWPRSSAISFSYVETCAVSVERTRSVR